MATIAVYRIILISGHTKLQDISIAKSPTKIKLGIYNYTL